jgi:hypothetical protein
LVDFDGAALTKLRERAADNATLIVPALAGREIRSPERASPASILHAR